MFSEKVHGGDAIEPGQQPHCGPWAPRQSFVNLLNNLHTPGTKGPNIRIGGDSADVMQFTNLPLPKGSSHKEMYNALKVDDIATYAYAALWNGTVTIDINILPADTTNSVEYAVAAMELLEPSLIDGFEIGNEPACFGNKGYKPKGWNFGDYNRLFKRYADALQTKGLMQMPRIQGAVFNQDWASSPIAQQHGGRMLGSEPDDPNRATGGGINISQQHCGSVVQQPQVLALWEKSEQFVRANVKLRAASPVSATVRFGVDEDLMDQIYDDYYSQGGEEEDDEEESGGKQVVANPFSDLPLVIETPSTGGSKVSFSTLYGVVVQLVPVRSIPTEGAASSGRRGPTRSPNGPGPRQRAEADARGEYFPPC